MSNSLRGSSAIVGVGLFGCGEARGFSEVEIAVQASLDAIKDADMKVSDIDGVIVASASDFMPTLAFAEHLGIKPKFADSNMVGGSSFVGHLLVASMALQSGVCNAVLVAYGSTQRTGLSRADASKARTVLDPRPFEDPYRPFNPPTAYALAAARHMYEFGTTREQLADVAVAARQWAQRNPAAFSRGPLTKEDVLSSAMVCDPLSVRDCCLVTDGAGAYVLVRASDVSKSPKNPVYILGTGMAQSHRQVSSMPSLVETAAKESGVRAFAMAKMSPADIDVLELYDAFTINPILFLEDLGFCKKGEGGAFVEGGRIAPGGKLPVNTNGGGLSCVHPGMYGIFALIEAVEQLRGNAGERQCADVDVGLVHGNGGVLSSQATAILGTANAL